MHWIIADVHGMIRPLETLVRQIDQRDPDRQLIFAGDYVNRGMDSRRVIDFLRSLKNARFIRGNHDDILDHIFNAHSYSEKVSDHERIASFGWFMNFGLYQTLRSYGATDTELLKATSRPSIAVLDHFKNLIPREHLEFIRNLGAVVEETDFFVAHAHWDVSRATQRGSMDAQLATDQHLRHMILWGRYSEEEIAAQKPWDRIGYFGHTPVVTYALATRAIPILGSSLVLLDTGAALPEGQRLTAWCHETREFLQADPSGKPVIS
jgi:serine/threonine protein phosphatase 1